MGRDTKAAASKTKRLYVRVDGTEYAEMPPYAVIHVTRKLVDEVLRLQLFCKKLRLATAEIWDSRLEIMPLPDGSEYRADCERLAVTKDSFQYVGFEKHTGLYWSTRSVKVRDLVAIAKATRRTEWFGAAKKDDQWRELEDEVREAQGAAVQGG